MQWYEPPQDKTNKMPRLIWVFAGHTCHFGGFVMRWLISSVSEVFWWLASIGIDKCWWLAMVVNGYQGNDCSGHHWWLMVVSTTKRSSPNMHEPCGLVGWTRGWLIFNATTRVQGVIEKFVSFSDTDKSTYFKWILWCSYWNKIY